MTKTYHTGLTAHFDGSYDIRFDELRTLCFNKLLAVNDDDEGKAAAALFHFCVAMIGDTVWRKKDIAIATFNKLIRQCESSFTLHLRKL
jgi:hypothetical protein